MGWRVTATTLFCDAVNDWVTVMVYPDGKKGCGHWTRHGKVSRKVGDKRLECNGPDCDVCNAYREDVSRRDAEAAKA